LSGVMTGSDATFMKFCASTGSRKTAKNKTIIKHLYTKFYTKLNYKFQHIEKQKWNKKLHGLHLNLIKDWNKSQFLIQQITNQLLDNKRQKKYKTIDSYLSQTWNRNIKAMDRFCPHVVNATKILLSNEEFKSTQ
jgi:type IV secretory pathway VirD2 relaxase